MTMRERLLVLLIALMLVVSTVVAVRFGYNGVVLDFSSHTAMQVPSSCADMTGYGPQCLLATPVTTP